MRPLIAVAAMIAALAPVSASGQIVAGLRVGYGTPWGDAWAGAPLRGQASSQLPFTLDLGLRVSRAVDVGVYASYGVVQLAEATRVECDAGSRRCAAADMRFGAQATLRSGRGRWVEPWVALAAGYEDLRFSVTGGGLPEDAWSLRGFDAALEAGLDFRISRGIRIGPFATATVGEFETFADGTEADLSGRRLHGWLQGGLRVLVGGGAPEGDVTARTGASPPPR